MLYKNRYLTAMLLCTCYGLMQATLLTHTGGSSTNRDRDLHVRLTTSAPTINNQLPSSILLAHAQAETDDAGNQYCQQDEHNTDCLPLCLVLTGECTGIVAGYPNGGTLVGTILGLLYEALQCISE